MGQRLVALLARVGSGDGGRSVEHKNDALFQAVKVKIDVVVKSVAENIHQRLRILASVA